MGEHLEKTVRALEERFGATSSTFRGEVTVFLQPHQIVEACTMLRDELDFEMLEDETAVDYWPEESPRFHVVYHIYSYKHNERIRLRVPLNGNNPSIPTIEGVYPNANWYEREVYDMFGIHYEGHSDLRRILMPHDWEGHPLRKDYPLGHEEIMFTFNFEEINSRKRYAQE